MKIFIIILFVFFVFSGCAQMTGNVSTNVHVERIETDGTSTIIDYDSYGDKQNIEGLKVENLFGANVSVDSRGQEGSFDSKLVEALLEQMRQLQLMYMQRMPSITPSQ